VGKVTVTDVLNSTVTVSGLAFAPIGLSLIGTRNLETTAASTKNNDRLSIGCGTSPTSRRSMGMLDADAVADALIDLTIQYDQVLCFIDATGALSSIYDINAMNSDGFQLICDANGAGSGVDWVGYLTFGSAPPISIVVICDAHARRRLL
jgi:hypothetical protein